MTMTDVPQVDITATIRQPTGTFSFKTRKGADEYFLSLPFPVEHADVAALERAIDNTANLVKAAVWTNAGIPWELGPDGRPEAGMPAQPSEARQAAAQVAPAVQQRQPRQGGGNGGGASTRDLGVDGNGNTVFLNPNGKYGPYVSNGSVIAKVPESCPLENVTLEKAIRWIDYKIQRQAQQ